MLLKVAAEDGLFQHMGLLRGSTISVLVRAFLVPVTGFPTDGALGDLLQLLHGHAVVPFLEGSIVPHHREALGLALEGVGIPSRQLLRLLGLEGLHVGLLLLLQNGAQHLRGLVFFENTSITVFSIVSFFVFTLEVLKRLLHSIDLVILQVIGLGIDVVGSSGGCHPRTRGHSSFLFLFNPDLRGLELCLVLADPFPDVSGFDGPSRVVEERLDVGIGEHQGVNEQETNVPFGKNDGMLSHLPHCHVPAAEEGSKVLILASAKMEGDLRQGGQQVLLAVLTEVLGELHEGDQLIAIAIAGHPRPIPGEIFHGLEGGLRQLLKE